MLLAPRLVAEVVPTPPGCRPLELHSPRFCGFETPEGKVLLVDVLTGAHRHTPYIPKQCMGMHGAHLHVYFSDDRVHVLYDVQTGETLTFARNWSYLCNGGACGMHSYVNLDGYGDCLRIAFTEKSPLKVVRRLDIPASKYMCVASGPDDVVYTSNITSELLWVSSDGSVKRFPGNDRLMFDPNSAGDACRIWSDRAGMHAVRHDFRTGQDVGQPRTICDHSDPDACHRIQCQNKTPTLRYTRGALVSPYHRVLKSIIDPSLLPPDLGGQVPGAWAVGGRLEAHLYGETLRVRAEGAAFPLYVRPWQEIKRKSFQLGLKVLDDRKIFMSMIYVGGSRLALGVVSGWLTLSRWGEAPPRLFPPPARRLAWVALALGAGRAL